MNKLRFRLFYILFWCVVRVYPKNEPVLSADVCCPYCKQWARIVLAGNNRVYHDKSAHAKFVPESMEQRS